MKKLLIKKRSSNQQLLRFDLKMKLSALFILITLFTLHANDSYSQRTKVSLDLNNVTVGQLIDEIENKTEFRFVYKIKDVNLQRLITIKANEELITSILKKAFLNTKTSYSIIDKQVFLIKKKNAVTPKEKPKEVNSNSEILSQEWTVTGIIEDSNGVPLPGASIIEKGTSNGTQTDFDGNFSLDISNQNAVLIISYLGYTTKEIPINGQSKISVVLADDVAALEEVVVIGYGKMKRSDLTGAVVSVSSKAIEQTVSTSIDQVLQGRAAGVQIQQNSGAPGASSSIRIRGVSSLQLSNEPIFVIDGVIISGQTGSNNDNPLSSINPSDILSMDVLKDASATAIYGSRGSNGVIIITTKRGKKGKLSLAYNTYIGYQEIPKKLSVLNLQEYAIHKNTRSDLGIVQLDNNFIRPELLGKGTNWQDEMFTKALMHSHNFSATGGSENTTYAMGIGYLDQEGIAIGSGFNRFNLRGVIDSQVKDYLKVGVNFALSNSKQENTFSEDGLIITALRQTPNVPVSNPDGSFAGPDDEFAPSNPVGKALLNENRNEQVGIRANVYAEINIIDGLKFKTEYALNYGFGNTYTFNPSYYFSEFDFSEVASGSRSKSFSKFWSWNNLLTYNKNFGNHSVNLILGQELQENFWENLFGSVSGYLSNGVTDLNAGDPTTANVNNNSNNSTISSYFGRLFYSFDDKYLLTATLRRDGSSRFADGRKWGTFPSLALAWKISNENFLKDSDVINNLKLRAGWGEVGNQGVPSNQYTTVLNATATNWGTGVLASNTANPDLEWETTSSSNIGVDLSLFNNRIEFIVDAYYKKTKNLLLQLPLPAYVGTTGQGSTSPPWVNIGSLENKGIELTLNTVNVSTDDFRWNTNLTFSKNMNKVLSLDSETGVIDRTLQEGSDITTVTRTAVGQPIGQYFGYKVIGRFEKATDFYYKNSAGDVVPTALPEGMIIGENGVWIGDYIFEDINKDGTINEQDLSYIGNPEADFTFGFGNTFTYKGFDLNIFLTGSYGNEVVNYQRRFLENPRNNHNLLSSALGYAQLDLIDSNGPNDYRNVQIVGGDPNMPRIAASPAASTSNFRFSNRFVEDGSYVRIKNISVGYNFPSETLSRFGLQALRVYTNTQNVFTFTKYSGYDPEIGSINQDALITGFDNGRYPSPLIFTVGLNVKF